jgi:orotidine-5'-phosphate decarboxylase
MTSQLIVALDYSVESEALDLIQQIDPTLCALKVGSEMFTLFGTEFIRNLVKQGYKVFLDLKFHDIPNTVAQACRAAADLGVWMINVHASGGFKMLEAANHALMDYGVQRPLLIAVTVLTSMSAEELPAIGILSNLEEQVIRLAKLAQETGLDGVVSSAHEVPRIKSNCGTSFLTVTPGIRLDNNNRDDQSRVVTPEQASVLGSDFLVVGRPITRSSSPATVINSILIKLRNVH